MELSSGQSLFLVILELKQNYMEALCAYRFLSLEQAIICNTFSLMVERNYQNICTRKHIQSCCVITLLTSVELKHTVGYEME